LAAASLFIRKNNLHGAKMAFTEKPALMEGQKPESVLHIAITGEVNKILQTAMEEKKIDQYFILPEFGVDVAIFLQKDDHKEMRFLELKAYAEKRQNGVGVGNGQGKGCQIDILLLDNSRLLLSDSFIQWIIWNAKAENEKCFALLSSSEAKLCVMGLGPKRGKQNNFNIKKVFEKSAITWDSISEKINKFILMPFKK
jgi:hypothetical protein